MVARLRISVWGGSQPPHETKIHMRVSSLHEISVCELMCVRTAPLYLPKSDQKTVRKSHR